MFAESHTLPQRLKPQIIRPFYAALKRCSTQKLKACWRRFLISLDQSGQRVPHPFDYAQGRLFAHFVKDGNGNVGTPYLSG